MTVTTKRPGNVAEPRPGQRLAMGSIATVLKISLSDMATATGISRSAVFNLLSDNLWPARTDPSAIRCALRTLFVDRGATDEQVEMMFHAHVKKLPASARVALVPPVGEPGASTPYDPIPGSESKTKVNDMLLPRQSLSPAARKAFELFKNPFAGEVTSADDLFQNGETRYVREACWQAAINASFVAVVGESGAGKTTILDDLKQRIDSDRKNVVLIEPSVLGMEDGERAGKTLKSADIQTAMVMTLDPLATVAQTSEKRARQVKELMTQRAKSGEVHLLIIEEAHSLPIATLKHLKRLHEMMRMGLRPMLGILLLAQPELKTKLQRYDTREVSQRCEVVTLQPLDGDLKLYLEHRAKTANRKLAEFIDDGGVEELRAKLTWAPGDKRAAPISLVYPLAVNNLMTAALNVAADLGAPVVTRDVVRGVRA